VCTLADPHSSAVIDVNGDCLAGELRLSWLRVLLFNYFTFLDLFLTCQEPNLNHQTFQIWTRSPGAQGGYTLAREGSLPKGAGPVSFADMGKCQIDNTVKTLDTIDAMFTCRQRRHAGPSVPCLWFIFFKNWSRTRLCNSHCI
jgi:hypothetical protein